MGQKYLEAPCDKLSNANDHPVAMVIHCHFTVPDLLPFTQKCFIVYVIALTYTVFQSVFTSNLCHLFLYESDKLKRKFSTLLTEIETYVLMFCSH